MPIRNLIIILYIFNAGCLAVNSHVMTTPSSFDLETCKITADVVLKGQILVQHHGMNLKVGSCPPTDLVERTLDFKHREERNKIWAVLSDAPGVYFQYVNITFLASETADGDILIERIIDAELTEESLYDDD